MIPPTTSLTPTSGTTWTPTSDVVAAADAVARTKADLNRSLREDDLVAEIERLRAALRELDEMIFNDPQTIDRAGDMRALIAGVLSE